ncbi:hypothetical protein ACQEV2_34785 [Streptomyces sp. CA-251387]|uniref:hypothetical protein n=1 Tax=Streptomyces sp. CA-251387 TaxID=3240064 RepID=UPI003D950AE9
MGTDRNGGEPLSGEAHDPAAASRPAAPHAHPARDLDDASALDRTAERLGEALRQQDLDATAEQAAVTAFRSARTAGDQDPRTRHQDDWRPKVPKRRWARGGAVAVAASALLGGIAFASIGVVDTPHADAPDTGATGTHSTRRPSADAPGEQPAPPARPGTTPTTPSRHPDTAKNVEAHCRSYEKIKNRGHAPNATAWQRLVQAAGGEEHVAAYCARLTGSVPEAEAGPAPTRTKKTPKGDVKTKPSKEPSEPG